MADQTINEKGELLTTIADLTTLNRAVGVEVISLLKRIDKRLELLILHVEEISDNEFTQDDTDGV